MTEKESQETTAQKPRVANQDWEIKDQETITRKTEKQRLRNEELQDYMQKLQLGEKTPRKIYQNCRERGKKKTTKQGQATKTK